MTDPMTPPPADHFDPQDFAKETASVLEADAKGFLPALFDTKFSHYVTPKVIRVIYVVLIIVAIIGWIVSIVTGFGVNAGAGILALLLGWIPALLMLTFWRMGLEVMSSVVNISEKMNAYAKRDGLKA